MAQAKTNILVVDDDEKIRRLLRNCFEPEGYGVFEAENFEEIKSTLSKTNINLITLDLNLGNENGLSIATAIKAESDTPIIIVTGKGDVIDKVVGLEMGADDYISKPFHVREVIARVRSVLRRTATPQKQEVHTANPLSRPRQLYEFGDWIADIDAFELKNKSGELCELTSTDFKLLKVLINNPKRVLSREKLMDLTVGYDWTPYDRTIDNQIARLRKKLETDPSLPRLIKTIRGVGYTFAVDVKAVQP